MPSVGGCADSGQGNGPGAPGVSLPAPPPPAMSRPELGREEHGGEWGEEPGTALSETDWQPQLAPRPWEEWRRAGASRVHSPF